MDNNFNENNNNSYNYNPYSSPQEGFPQNDNRKQDDFSVGDGTYHTDNENMDRNQESAADYLYGNAAGYNQSSYSNENTSNMDGTSYENRNFANNSQDIYHKSTVDAQYSYTDGNGNGTGNSDAKKKNSFAGFGVTLTKTIAIALVFGLVAGTAGLSVLHFGGEALGVFAEVDDRDEDSDNDSDSDKLQDTEEDDRTVTGGVQQTSTDTLMSVALMDASDIVKSAMPCVVAINNTAEITYQNWWGQMYTDESESCGTGFLIEQDENYIYIATNNHVVEGATTLTVQFSDGAVVEAQIKGTVASKDLAVITVALEDISAETLSVIRLATLGDSNDLEAGEAAIAIGNALGYGQSVTTGVVSALGRSVTVQDSTSGTTIVNNNLIQTSAAINPGNSGGPLLNIKGEVIGINSVKYSDTSVEGIGYAIPISDAMLIIDKLIDGEKIETAKSGYLGIQGLDSAMGAYIYKVLDGSAAEKAGLRAGDIITEMEGTQISTMSQLQELLSYYPAGEEVELVILRPNGNEYVEQEITVVLGDASTISQ